MFSIDDIKEMRPGHQPEGMKRYATKIPTDRCFTIVFKGTRKNLDLVASNANQAWHWIRGLSKLKQRGCSMNKREQMVQNPSRSGSRQSARERGYHFPHGLQQQPPSPPLPHAEGQRHLPMLEAFAVCFPYVTCISLRPSDSMDSISY
ncbi:1-phosphatidylinositol 4,5-bisphosphate phosphodiesterase delta-1-like [Mobula hypostoma]|uniref:1-phosphatidylinositol 4,5-bisphosphate phosphodiesterase delta-1-like n=1 Tax=Mobula hypostoma TaxID=723540 RepID=UPI002FC37D81